jgi:hypothetical protein
MFTGFLPAVSMDALWRARLTDRQAAFGLAWRLIQNGHFTHFDKTG